MKYIGFVIHGKGQVVNRGGFPLGVKRRVHAHASNLIIRGFVDPFRRSACRATRRCTRVRHSQCVTPTWFSAPTADPFCGIRTLAPINMAHHSRASGDGQEEGSTRTQRLRDGDPLSDDEDEQRSSPETFPPLLERDPGFFHPLSRPSLS